MIEGSAARRRSWPIAVRRALPGDRDAVLSFATSTWDGWDYIPHAWPVWLDATDGVLLVAAPQGSATDAAGEALEEGRPIAVARVAMAAPTEAWLEGIRVDPRVRGMDVATDLQVAELHICASLGAKVVRYATGQRNEGSHRLGARHGFELLVRYRTWSWTAGDDEEDEDDEHGFDAAARAQATDRRRALLAKLTAEGLGAEPADAQALWRRLTDDSTFRLAHSLYEYRAWALQELTKERFFRHLAGGEVLASGPTDADGWALAILPTEALPAEDVSLHLALLAGDGPAAIRLASKIRRLATEPIRFRLRDADPPLPGAPADDLAAAGFRAREWRLDILSRPLDEPHPPPELEDAWVVLAVDAKGVVPVG